MSTVQLSVDMIDASFLVGVVDQVWHRSINRTILPNTQSVSMPPGSYLDWSWEFDYWKAIPDPLVNATITISPSGLIVPLTVIQDKYFTIWVSGAVSGQTYAMTYWVEKESGEQIVNTTWLSAFGTLPPPIQ